MFKFYYQHEDGIVNSFPQNDESTLWIESDGLSINDFLQASKVKWPDVSL